MNIRTLTCTFIGLLVLAAMLMLTPKHPYSPCGIALPSKITHASIPNNEVAILRQAPSGNFQTLGEVRAEMAFNQLDTETQDRLLDYVKTQAAKLGANGVVINVFVPGDGLRSHLTFIGTAISIPRSA